MCRISEPQVPIRWGNSAPGKSKQPAGQHPPRKSQHRRAFGKASVHTTPALKKQSGVQHSNGSRNRDGMLPVHQRG